MIAVIFEVEPHKQYKQDYLDIALNLRSELERIEGFISIERFQSLTDDTKILSLSFFEDEEAVKEWRNLHSHRQAQKAGRNTLFRNYRLRITNVIRDYGMEDREQVPSDSASAHPQ